MLEYAVYTDMRQSPSLAHIQLRSASIKII